MFVILIQILLRFYHSVDGKWASWIDTPCTKTCGNGSYTRSRSCNNPSPAHGGKECLLFNKTGSALTETLFNQSCNTQACPGEYY